MLGVATSRVLGEMCTTTTLTSRTGVVGGHRESALACTLPHGSTVSTRTPGLHSPKGSLRGGDERVEEDDTWTVVLTERQGGGEERENVLVEETRAERK